MIGGFGSGDVLAVYSNTHVPAWKSVSSLPFSAPVLT